MCNAMTQIGSWFKPNFASQKKRRAAHQIGKLTKRGIH